MEPEEIDKLFREKLAGRPALPSPEAWMRLQQKMETPKKERTMWIYYAAASVVVVLMAGLFFFRQGQQAPGPGLATTTPPERTAPAALPEQTPPARVPLAATTPAIREQAQTASAAFVIREQKPESRPQAPRVAVKSPRRQQQPRALQSEAPIQLASKDQQEVAAPEQPAPVLAGLSAPQPAGASAAPDLSVVEVKVQRNAQAEEEPGLRENLNRKGQLLKSIYKQARNLKNGERVELAALGVNEGRLQEETQELKQKISNVISL